MTPKDLVYNFISEQLTTGKLKRTDHITEQYLADNLGISRTPIREALLLLAADSILEREPRKGYRIKVYTQQDVEELYVLIGTLEGKIAELAIDHLTTADYDLMKFTIDSMYSAIEHKLYTKYNELQKQFHAIYVQKCPNQVLRQELANAKRTFIGKNYLHQGQADTQKILRTTNKEHEKIEQLFEAHQVAELRHYLETTHWSATTAQYDVWS